jgi:phosphohistidine swiveling domain-containing protein
MTVTPQPTPIPVPEDFPVQWQSPDDEEQLWQWGNTHFPSPVSPLGMELVLIALGPGMEKGLKAMGTPIREMRFRQINTFGYMAMVPDFDQIPTAEERMQAAIKKHGYTIYQRWLEEWQPEVEAAIQRLLEFDYQAATDAELAALVDWVVGVDKRMWEIHFELMPGFYLAAVFKEGCGRLLGLSKLEAYEMMQGGYNMSVESASKLWRLARAAAPEVKETVASLPAAEALARLRESESGRAFLAELDRYTHEYGWRTGSLDIVEPSWIEEPTRALDNVRMMLRVDADPEEDQRRGAERAEALAEQHRATLAGDPEKLAEFNFLYDVVKQYPMMQENHNFYIDQKYRALLRQPFLEVGRRMTERGLLGGPRDFVYLHLDEIKDFLTGDRTPRVATVAERRAEMERWQTHVPPTFLGTQPPELVEEPFWSDFLGVPAEPSRDPKVVKGMGASRGTATGTARVVRTLADTDRVEDGDILICDMTTPAWTPLFAFLGGIVADSGGPLSHCAVLAREYGLPCVTGTIVGTRVIPDGAQITVDGSQGIVRIHA